MPDSTHLVGLVSRYQYSTGRLYSGSYSTGIEHHRTASAVSTAVSTGAGRLKMGCPCVSDWFTMLVVSAAAGTAHADLEVSRLGAQHARR